MCVPTLLLIRVCSDFAQLLVIIYKLCSLFSASVELYTLSDRLNVVNRSENSHWDKGLKGIDCNSFIYMNRQ